MLIRKFIMPNINFDNISNKNKLWTIMTGPNKGKKFNPKTQEVIETSDKD